MKLAKYGDLVEVGHMWQCQTKVVPVALGALGTVHAGIARKLDIVPGPAARTENSASGICSDPP